MKTTNNSPASAAASVIAAAAAPQSEAEKQAELDARAAEARLAEANTGKPAETTTAKQPEAAPNEAEKPVKAVQVERGEPKGRVLTKKAFINGRLYEAGETVDYDEDGNFLAVPKSTPAGDLTEDQLRQLLAQAQAKSKGQSGE